MTFAAGIHAKRQEKDVVAFHVMGNFRRESSRAFWTSDVPIKAHGIRAFPSFATRGVPSNPPMM